MNKAEQLLLNDKDPRAEVETKCLLVDIQHPKYVWLVQLGTASWLLIKKEEMGAALCDACFLEQLTFL